jgi:glycosyltransferase involved in cell wall biosynthesis
MTSSGLRVLLTTDAVGGVWVFSSTLAAGLTDAGCEVLLVTLGPPPSRQQLEALADKPIDLRITDLALEWMDPEAADHKRACRQLEQIEREFSPDVVHLNSFREAAADWSAPVLVGAHSCVRSWWQACRGGDPDEPRWRAYIENVRSGLNAADAWVAPTAAFRDSVHALYRPAVSGHVVWNGVEPVGAKAKQPFILAAGRLWDEAKNVSALVSAASALKWPLRICGSTAGPPTSLQKAAGVEWLGELSRDDTLAQMRRAEIFATPTLYEPFGLAALEAASAGCALVLGDIPTLRELWSGAAHFVQPNEHVKLTQTLNRLCTEGALRRRMQDAARLRASEYSASRMVASYQQFYRALLGNARRPAGERATSIHEIYA